MQNAATEMIIRSTCKSIRLLECSDMNKKGKLFKTCNYCRKNDKIYEDKHKDISKGQAKLYYESHKEEIKEQRKAYGDTHKEEIKERQKAYRDTHKEQIK